MEQLMELIASSSLFAPLSPADQNKVVNLANHQKYLSGRIVKPPEEALSFLLMVASGRLDIVKLSTTGRTVIIDTIKRNGICWGHSFFCKQCHINPNVFLRMHESGCVYFWTRDDLVPILWQNGKAVWELCQLVAQRAERIGTLAEEIAFHPVKKRVANFLIEKSKQTGDDSIQRRGLTLDEIAEHVFTTREGVCRMLYLFSDLGLLQVNREEVYLIDQAGLEQIAIAEDT